MEYSKKQLAEIVKGCFKTSNEPAFYGSVNGTFYNANQKSKLSKEDQEKLIEFKNPKFESAEKSADKNSGSAQGGAPDLSKLTVPALKQYAAEHGVELKAEETTKAAIIAAIKAAEEASEEEEGA